MIPSFTRVALTLKGLIENKVDAGESKINLTADISKATLDIIGLVGEKIKDSFFSVDIFIYNSNFLSFFRI